MPGGRVLSRRRCERGRAGGHAGRQGGLGAPVTGARPGGRPSPAAPGGVRGSAGTRFSRRRRAAAAVARAGCDERRPVRCGLVCGAGAPTDLGGRV